MTRRSTRELWLGLRHSFVIRASSFQSFQIRKQRWMLFLGRQPSRPLFAFFHDILVERGIDGEGVIAGKTRETKLIHVAAGCAHHSFDVEIAKAVYVQILADLFHRHLIGDELFRVGEINPVMAGESMGWTAHPHMHFFGARFA